MSQSKVNTALSQAKSKISGFIRHFTTKKHARSDAFQQSIIDGLGEPIMVIGLDYKVKLMNRAALEFASEDAKAFDSICCYQISHQLQSPCSGKDHPCPLEEVRKALQPVTVVHEHYRANGERRFVEIVAAPFLEADGSLQGIIESMRDVTERKRTEEALQQHAVRLRALAAQMDEVAENERQRLARELHDKVGQNLTAIGINLNIIQSAIPEDISKIVQFHIEDSCLLVEQTAERIRDVMADLRSPLLDDYGLEPALRWYGEQFSRRTGIEIIMDTGELFQLDERSANALFRIAQEALTNVAKHAQATQVTISLQASNDTFCMTIYDNGVGFDTRTAPSKGDIKGWGLLTMSERAEAIGGRWSIQSTPGKGTQIRVEVLL